MAKSLPSAPVQFFAMISGHSARVMVGDHLFKQLISLNLLARDIPPANNIFEALQRTILLKELRRLLQISLTTSPNGGRTNLSSGELFSYKGGLQYN